MINIVLEEPQLEKKTNSEEEDLLGEELDKDEDGGNGAADETTPAPEGHMDVGGANSSSSTATPAGVQTSKKL